MALIDVLSAVSKKPNSDLFVVDLEGTEVCFSLPSFKQASQYASVLAQLEDNNALKSILYEHLFQTYVQNDFLAVHDEEIGAGAVETIARLILQLSGIEGDFRAYTEELLGIYRDHMNSVVPIMCARICSVFGGYKISDLVTLNFQDLVQVYVHAERILLNRGIIEEELRFANPEDNKPVNVAKMIDQDAKDYARFNQEGPRQKLTDTPEYQQKAEAFAKRMKKNLS